MCTKVRYETVWLPDGTMYRERRIADMVDKVVKDWSKMSPEEILAAVQAQSATPGIFRGQEEIEGGVAVDLHPSVLKACLEAFPTLQGMPTPNGASWQIGDPVLGGSRTSQRRNPNRRPRRVITAWKSTGRVTFTNCHAIDWEAWLAKHPEVVGEVIVDLEAQSPVGITQPTAESETTAA